MVPLLLSLSAGLGFVLATLLVRTTLGTSRSFHQVSVVIAAGILLGVTFVNLIPEALELLGGTSGALSIAVGFLALFLVEALTGGHTHHHEPHQAHLPDGAPAHAHAHPHSHGSATDDDSCIPQHAVLPFLIGIGLHNFVDGVVIGASNEVSNSAAAGVAIGILVHQMPVGLSFAAVLLSSKITRARMRRDALLMAALIPIGALVVLLAPDPSNGVLGGLIGVAAGALIYIATGHLLPEAHSEERRPGVALAFATALLASVVVIGAL